MRSFCPPVFQSLSLVIPPRNVNWFKKGKWVQLVKMAFETYFIRKMKTGNLEPLYEKYVLKLLGTVRLKQDKPLF